MRSTGLVFAAGGIAIANEVLFAPVNNVTGAAGPTNIGISVVQNFNWRIIPATLALALALGGLEKVAPDFAVGLAGLTVLAVIVIPHGNAPTPLENLAAAIGQ